MEQNTRAALRVVDHLALLERGHITLGESPESSRPTRGSGRRTSR